MLESAKAVAPLQAGSVRILDDDPQVLKLLIHAVGTLGYQVEGFFDPVAFLGNGSVPPPPLALIVDWQLAGYDGLEILAKAQQQWPNTPGFLVSGHVTVPVTVSAMRQGLAGVLQKPIAIAELKRELAAAIARAESRTTLAQERAAAKSRVRSLSELELSILKLLVEGTPNKNIATQTQLAIRTVEKYRRIVFDKLVVDSAAEATRVWVLATLEQ